MFMEDAKFWLVWSPRNKGVPRRRHETLESAVAESARLSEKLPGRHFYILECMGYAMDGPEIPTKAQAKRLLETSGSE